MAEEFPKRPVSVTILGGFLGAGKTTLLSHVLQHARGAKIGVLVNDFGSVNIDAELISEVSGEVMKLTNGCICCTIRGDVPRALFKLIEAQPLDHVIIESSGISDPRAIADAFLEMHKNRLIRLDGLVSVVDAENFLRTLAAHQELAEAQIQAADLVVLSKVDLTGEERAAQVEELIRQKAPRARIARAEQGALATDVVLAIDRDVEALYTQHGAAEQHAQPRSPSQPHEHPQPHEHEHSHARAHDSFTSWTFDDPRPLSWRDLAPVLAQLPPQIFRVKGIVQLVERPGDRILVHVVGGRVHVRTLEPWRGGPPRSQLVFIGSFEPSELEPRIRACAVGAPTAGAHPGSAG